MTNSISGGETAWYCLRAKPKSEHVAAAHLGRIPGIESFCPRIRFEKVTRRGKVWFVEALFPGYLFARFDLPENLRRVQATASVLEVVHFRDDYPALSSAVVESLRTEIGGEEPKIVEAGLREGDDVLITDGAMTGLQALVTRVLPGNERIRILLNWLGQEREAEIARSSLARPGDVRAGMGASGLA